MKNKILWLAMLLFPVVLGSCSKDEDIVFDHERQMFEIQDGKILLEVILPGGTTDGEEIYISGAFNGGDEVAVGKDEFKLIRTDLSTIKRAVYLDPSTFVDGKTLADGFHFVSSKQRQEVDLTGADKWHYDNPGVGTSTNITVDRWAAFYDSGEGGGEGGSDTDPDVEHDGYVVYVDDQTGWDALALYAWGDAEAFGGWPGKLPDGTMTIGGVEYVYFNIGEANTGLNLNFIPNNNGGGVQWEGASLGITADHDIFVRIWDGDASSFEILEQ